MQPVSRADIRHIQFNSVDGSHQVPVNADFLEQLGFPANLSMLILKDRDTSSSQLNDQVLVVKSDKQWGTAAGTALTGCFHAIDMSSKRGVCDLRMVVRSDDLNMQTKHRLQRKY